MLPMGDSSLCAIGKSVLRTRTSLGLPSHNTPGTHSRSLYFKQKKFNNQINMKTQMFNSGLSPVAFVTTNSATSKKCVSLYDLRGIH